MSVAQLNPAMTQSPSDAPKRAPKRLNVGSFWFPSCTYRWTPWHAWAAAFMAAMAVMATLDAWRDIYSLAVRDEEYSHIFLVPVVVLWLVWVRRQRFRYCKPTGTALGFIFAIVGWLMTTLGFYSGTQSLWHGGAVLLVVGCAMSVLGKHVLFRFFPAVLVLVFLIPVPGFIRQQIALPLETWTARIAQYIFDVCDIPVRRNANLLSVNNKPVNIPEACNGMRMVFALALVGFAFCFGLPLRNGVRLLIVGCSPLATLFCNVLRIVPTIWMFAYSSKPAGEVFHTYSGWLMLPISFLMLVALIKVLRWANLPVMRYTLAS